MDRIDVFFCKDFPEVVRQARCNEAIFLETKHSLVDGLIYWTGEVHSTAISQKVSEYIDLMAANGYTVTAFVRLSDFFEVIPIPEEFQKAVAMTVNKRIFAEAFPEVLPN